MVYFDEPARLGVVDVHTGHLQHHRPIDDAISHSGPLTYTKPSCVSRAAPSPFPAQQPFFGTLEVGPLPKQTHPGNQEAKAVYRPSRLRPPTCPVQGRGLSSSTWPASTWRDPRACVVSGVLSAQRSITQHVAPAI